IAANTAFSGEPPAKMSDLPRECTVRRSDAGRITVSEYARWFEARITGPWSGMCSAPLMVGFQTADITARTGGLAISYSTSDSSGGDSAARGRDGSSGRV